MEQQRESLPENQADGKHEHQRRSGLRRAWWMLVAAGIGVISFLVLEPRSRERALEAESRAPITRPLPEPEPALEAPAAEIVPTEPLLPESSPAWSVPGETVSPPTRTGNLPALNGPSYVGPRAPEFTGAPAPAGAGLVDGVLFGHSVLGLHPELLRRLRQVELTAPAATLGAEPPLGVEMIVAYRKGSRAHSRGLAVDINYFGNPYIMHERGEEKLDERLGTVYQRVSRMMLRRDSVIPVEITEGTPERERTLRLYRALRDESRAMVAYFRLMQDRDALARYLASQKPRVTENPVDLQRQMAQDYVTLSGRSGPLAPGLEYPPPNSMGGDPPFAGDPVYRGPELGFLHLSEDLVRALTDAGLRWGGTDMGDSSGDLMHFYLPASEAKPSGLAGR